VICTNRENARGPTVNSDAQREPDVHREAP
jgi:hypothetical protein